MSANHIHQRNVTNVVMSETSRVRNVTQGAEDNTSTRSNVPSQVLPSPTNASELNALSDKELQEQIDLEYMVIKRLIQWLSGKEVKVFDANHLVDDNATSTSVNANELSISSEPPPPEDERAVNSTQTTQMIWQRFQEKESLDFNASMQIQTASGQSISINYQMQLDRAYVEERLTTLTTEELNLSDPLIINLDNSHIKLSDERVDFDLNSDGVAEAIPVLEKGSAFLALDKNGNGTIDNGDELFGTHSGNGFADLKAYDEDGNGFIDEQDSIFAKLKLWQINAEGESKLFDLAHFKLGAIYLNAQNTPYTITDEANNTLGVIRQTSLAIKEDGRAHAISQVDLNV